MLKFNLNQSKDGFNIQFDMPLHQPIVAHREFQPLMEMFASKADCSFDYAQDNALTHINGSIQSLMAICDELLPPYESKIQKALLKDIVLNSQGLEKKGLDVNFHQNPFDSIDRYWHFILNQGHFVSYFFNRLNWYAGPQNGYVTPFPLHVDIESASTCNMNCPMCYRDMLKESGQMEMALFKKAVDECAAHHVFSIRLSWRGETLTHPRIKEMIAYATQKIKNVSFLTNAFYLDEAMIDCFIDNRLSYLAVSFDGIDEVYESIRHPAKFEENYNRLALLQEKKRKANSHYPQVRLCTIWPAIKNDPDAYYKKMRPVSDYMVCNPYINFKGPKRIKPDFICQYPWERIVIGYDGRTQCCTGWNADDIILGNVTDDTIENMWHSERMQQIRDLHAKGKRMELNSCVQCRHGSESDTEMDIWDIVKRQY